MTGIVAILYEGGWAVSNEAVFDADKHLIEVDGKKVSKSVLTIKANAIFECKGQITEGQSVECIFKTLDDKKHAFIGKIKTRGKQVTTIHELLKSERYTEILNKLKQ